MKLITTISKYLAAFGTVAAVVWGGYKIYDTIIDTQEMVVDVWDNQNIIETNINLRLESIEDSLGRIENKVEKNSRDIYTISELTRYEREHRGELPLNQMNDILDQMEEERQPSLLMKISQRKRMIMFYHS